MKSSNYKIVAEAVRMECDQNSGELFIVFQVIDEDFKKRIKDNWMEDIDLELVGRKLVTENK